MRIVHLPQRFFPSVGGVEMHVRQLAREQLNRGHEVFVVTGQEPGSAPHETVDGIDVTRLPMRLFRGHYLIPPWLRTPGMAEAALALKPDVVHAHGYRFYSVEAAAQVRRRAGVPYLVTSNGFHPAESRFELFTRRAYDAVSGRRVLQAASRCIAVAEHEAHDYVRLGVPRERVTVIPNGLPARAFETVDAAGFRAQHGLDGPLVSFISRITKAKGTLDFVRAAREVPDATFAVFGPDGGALAEAKSIATPNVRFLGPLSDTRPALAASDIFCLPSNYEAHSLVLSEAMAQGRCVVTTDAAGNAEAVGDAGEVVPVGAPSALAAAFRKLLADDAARKRMGDAALRRARRWAWSEVVKLAEQAYETAMRDGARAR